MHVQQRSTLLNASQVRRERLMRRRKRCIGAQRQTLGWRRTCAPYVTRRLWKKQSLAVAVAAAEGALPRPLPLPLLCPRFGSNSSVAPIFLSPSRRPTSGLRTMSVHCLALSLCSLSSVISSARETRGKIEVPSLLHLTLWWWTGLGIFD